MEITLPDHLQLLVEQKVGNGEYASATDVVSEGLKLLIERDAGVSEEAERWRVLIAEGLAQLDAGKRINGREAFARFRANLNARQAD